MRFVVGGLVAFLIELTTLSCWLVGLWRQGGLSNPKQCVFLTSAWSVGQDQRENTGVWTNHGHTQRQSTGVWINHAQTQGQNTSVWTNHGQDQCENTRVWTSHGLTQRQNMSVWINHGQIPADDSTTAGPSSQW